MTELNRSEAKEVVKWLVMDDREVNDAGASLVEWFKSQDIKPADGVRVMLATMANAVWAISEECNVPQRKLRKAIAKSFASGKLIPR